MSKIEVDAIDKQSGSTLTLGGSGTAVTLASGATQSGFGRTGTVDWQTGSIKTATFTAASGEGYFCNTAGGAFELDLPAGSAGAIVSIQDYNNTFDSNALTVDPNGSEKINGGSAGAPITLTTEGQGITFVYIDATVGWRSVQDNDFSVVGSNYVVASGGTETTSGDYKIHTFTGPGNLTISSAGTPGGSNTIDYLVVAGGGGGGSNPSYGDSGRGGGGGAGGYRESSGAASGSYTRSPLGACVAALPVSVTSYPVTVGAGAVGGFTSKGSNSVFAGSTTITSTGGGTGGVRNPAYPSPGDPAIAGSPGGSGGGGGTYAGAGPVGNGNTPPVSPPQGNNGGPGTEGPPNYGAGGGGGATAVGATGTTPAGGAGGAGATSCITGSPVARAGGGGGAVYGSSPAAGGGGSGGGGQGAGRTGPIYGGVNGTANTGGGGGGGGGTCGFTGGGTGGSGVVVIRYKFQN